MKWIVLGLIRFYQMTISPIKGTSCRFYPSCSEYAYVSVKKYGVIKGMWLGLKRFSRCFGRGIKVDLNN